MTTNQPERLDQLQTIVEGLINANVAAVARMDRIEAARERERHEINQRIESDRREIETARERERREINEQIERDRRESNERMTRLEQSMEQFQALVETSYEPVQALLEASTRHEAMIERLDAIIERMIYREGRDNEG